MLRNPENKRSVQFDALLLNHLCLSCYKFSFPIVSAKDISLMTLFHADVTRSLHLAYELTAFDVFVYHTDRQFFEEKKEKRRRKNNEDFELSLMLQQMNDPSLLFYEN